jgi:hypothetical protein
MAVVLFYVCESRALNRVVLMRTGYLTDAVSVNMRDAIHPIKNEDRWIAITMP